jgi:hypothetical protein
VNGKTRSPCAERQRSLYFMACICDDGLQALLGRRKSEGEATLFLFVAGAALASLPVKATVEFFTAGVTRFLLKCIQIYVGTTF